MTFDAALDSDSAADTEAGSAVDTAVDSAVDPALIDPIFGPITNIAQQPVEDTEPEGLVTYSAAVSNLGPYVEWLPDRAGTGCGFDRSRAQGAALGEAVERYCGNYVPTDEVRQASFRELLDGGHRAVDPLTAWPFEDSDAEVAFGRFSKPTDHDVIGWTRLTTPAGEQVYAPAAQVYLNYYRARPQERRSFPVVLPGIAAGLNLANAINSAALEILERDATALWWIGGASAIRIEPANELRRRLEPKVGRDIQQESYLLRAYGSGQQVFAVAHVLWDRANDSLQVGFACRPDLEEAIAKAAAESWQLRRLDRAVRDPDSWVWRARQGQRPLPVLDLGDFHAHENDPAPMHPSDQKPIQEPMQESMQSSMYESMTQLVHNLQFYCANPQRQQRALEMIRSRAEDTADSSDYPRAARDPDLFAVAQSEGIDLLWKDVTTPDINELGMTVVRVYSTTACPNMATAFPPLGNARLRDHLDNTGQTPNLAPLPHA